MCVCVCLWVCMCGCVRVDADTLDLKVVSRPLRQQWRISLCVRLSTHPHLSSRHLNVCTDQPTATRCKWPRGGQGRVSLVHVKGNFLVLQFFPLEHKQYLCKGSLAVKLSVSKGKNWKSQEFFWTWTREALPLDIHNARRKKYIEIYNAQKH